MKFELDEGALKKLAQAEMERQVKAAVSALNVPDMFREAVEKHASPVIEKLVTKATAEAVKRVIEEGFQGTDSYGCPTGPKLSIRDLCIKHMTRREYGNGQSLIEKWSKDLVEASVKRTFETEFADAKAKLRKQIDDGLAVRIAGLFKAAVE